MLTPDQIAVLVAYIIYAVPFICIVAFLIWLSDKLGEWEETQFQQRQEANRRRHARMMR